jgi:hypothetical protein
MAGIVRILLVESPFLEKTDLPMIFLASPGGLTGYHSNISHTGVVFVEMAQMVAADEQSRF